MAKLRWNSKLGEEVENEEIDKFLKEIKEVCKKHNMSIAHQDEGGGFIIENYDDIYIKWLSNASIGESCFVKKSPF